jgi:hypothetical protein
MDNQFLCLPEAAWIGIQAIATILTFGALIVYAIDTRKIRKATLSQSEAARRPYISAIPRTDSDGENSRVLFVNQGSGPILNLTVSHLKGYPNVTPNYNGAVGVQESFYACFDYQKFIDVRDISEFGVRFSYTDTAKKRYWTTIRLVNNNMYVSDTGEE